MKKKITRNGNSACLILGSDLLGFLGASVGDYVNIEFSGGQLLVGSLGAAVVARRRRVARKPAVVAVEAPVDTVAAVDITEAVDADVVGMASVVNLYRQYCVVAGMPDIRKSKRGLPSSVSLATSLKARWKQSKDLVWWEKYFKAVSEQAFFCGDNERGWRASLKWLCGRSKFEEWQDTLSNKELSTPKKKTRSLDYSYSAEDEWNNPSH